MRYLIASLLDPQSDSTLRQAYQDAFHESCRVRTLHLTYIPPFTTENLHPITNLLASLKQPPLTYSTLDLGIFSRHRNILYLPLEPITPLQTYYQTLLPPIRNQITFEASGFPLDQIPDFLPHITLSYDFKLDKSKFHSPPTITLLPPTLLEETSPGIWQPRQG